MGAKRKTVADLDQEISEIRGGMDKILAAVAGNSQPETDDAEETSEQAQEVVARNLPSALNTEPTKSGQGFQLGATYATQERKDGTVIRRPRIYCVPTTGGSTQPSDKNQFGMLRANSVHPEVVKLIAANPERAVKLAEWVAAEQD